MHLIWCIHRRRRSSWSSTRAPGKRAGPRLAARLGGRASRADRAGFAAATISLADRYAAGAADGEGPVRGPHRSAGQDRREGAVLLPRQRALRAPWLHQEGAGDAAGGTETGAGAQEGDRTWLTTGTGGRRSTASSRKRGCSPNSRG